MSKLLLSTVNAGKGIFTVDTDDPKNCKRLYPNLYPMGVCKFEDGFILADRYDGIFILDKNLSIVENYFSRKMEQLHDVMLIGKNIFVVESAKNAINIIDIDSGQLIDSVQIFNKDFDSNHLNSLKFHNGEFYLSMFSFESIDDVKRSRHKGTIAKLDKNLKITGIEVEGLSQPHSICFIDDILHYANSCDFTICRNQMETVISAPLYTRGLAYDENYIYVGQNNIRNTAHDKNTTQTSIRMYDRNYSFIRSVELPAFEIYDIIILED